MHSPDGSWPGLGAPGGLPSILGRCFGFPGSYCDNGELLANTTMSTTTNESRHIADETVVAPKAHQESQDVVTSVRSRATTNLEPVLKQTSSKSSENDVDWVVG
eukprot:SAG31_NODE_24759_length_474_cov_1.797333_1_plen_103_part_10